MVCRGRWLWRGGVGGCSWVVVMVVEVEVVAVVVVVVVAAAVVVAVAAEYLYDIYWDTR